MGTRTLYLVRHGQYVTNEAHDEYGLLTALGRRQAHRTAKRLAAIDFASMFHSDTIRAVETASIIADELRTVPRHSLRTLRELMPPLTKRSDGKSRTRQEIADVKAATRQLTRQFLRPLKGNRSRHELIVAHGNLIRYFVRLALEEPVSDWIHFATHHCGITVVVVRDPPSNYLVSYNDIGHLPLSMQTMA